MIPVKSAFIRAMKRYCVYFLECSDGTVYTGVTSQLHVRLWRHQHAYYPGSYTASRLPVTLLGYVEFQWIQDAIKFEKKAQCWSAAKKRALAAGKLEELKRLSKKKFRKKIPSNS